jgi:tRNA modification GTPase
MAIFAPITSIGGAITTIRISGNDSLSCLNYFSINKNLTPNAAHFCRIYDKNTFLDEVIVVYFKSPHSFTGEDTLEFSLHSSKFIIKKFLDILSSIKNFSFAKAGEFSKIAMLNGKIDLLKSEGINSLVKSETQNQHRLASKMLSGDISSKYNSLRYKIIQIISILEVLIDFPEEDIPQEVFENAVEVKRDLITEIEFFLNDKHNAEKIFQGIAISIIGNTNAGKSSLLNFLAKKEVAIVSDIAGTTRDILRVDIEINNNKVSFFDTAGIRESNDIIEKEGIKRALQLASNSDINLLVIDISQEMDLEFQILELIHKDRGCEFLEKTIIILNKIDLIDQDTICKKVEQLRATIKAKYNIYFEDILCVAIKFNTEEIINFIAKKIEKQLNINFEPIVFNERHRSLLISALEALKEVDFYSKQIDLLVEDLGFAANKIGLVTGQIYNDDILDFIFSKFCIGK